MKTIKIAALAIILLASCSKESDDITPSSSNNVTAKVQAARPRPFEAILSAAVDVNSSNPPTACSGDAPFAAPDFVLTGDVSHMGATNGTLHHDACNLSLANIPFVLTTSISGQIVAANGDYITYTGNDVVDVTNFVTQTGTTGGITGTWTITGGTGRFAGATGSFNINGTVDFVTNTFTCSAVGTITY